MKILLTEKTRQEKIIEKRNLFGLGLTSLIAACSAADNAAEDEGVGIGKRPETDLEAAELAWSVVISGDTTSKDGIDGRSSVKDIEIKVIAGDRGADTDKGSLVYRIANGHHFTGSAHASIYTGLITENQYDLVVSSDNFGEATANGGDITGAVYIFWDIKDKTAADLGDAVKTLAQTHLKVAGVAGSDIISFNSTPTFRYIGGVKDVEGNDQYDMIFESGSANINILWDVAQYAATDTEEPETLLTLGTSAGILQVQSGTTGVTFQFTKTNNNEDYDMLVTGLDPTYILWDVAKYYDADATDPTPVVNFADPNTATHGLLKIEGRITIKKAKDDEGKDDGFIDIDEKGINDIAFISGSTDTYTLYILFGEKVADRDKDGKAISHTVDLSTVADGDFYDKNDKKVTGLAEGGFFHYDLDDNPNTVDVKQVGYGFADDAISINITLADIANKYKEFVDPTSPAEGGGLSEEVYWDIA